MRVLSAIGGGLAGAFALTLLHEIVRRVDEDAPRMDLLGMDAIAKGLTKTGQNVPDHNSLYALTFAGDIISNTFYYSLAAAGNKKYVFPKGTMLGLAAGLGALFLPKQIGLNPRHSNKTLKTQLLTTGFYLAGGLVASVVSKAIERKKDRKVEHHPQLWV
ncbi:hypothetical protein [Desertivirga xinjiangensis]|uniref:hypothetical protein n=1 Tax=Desertivirga xinjiangensis TaxID=539206 RepID=UPI00210CA7D5|nr:hypothetical protein [Pedobacter xinjiangensis]